MTFELHAVAQALNCPPPPVNPAISGWSIDSRTIAPGDLFFALRGPAHDGHLYLDDVFARGSSAAVVEKRNLPGSPLLQVDDTLIALQRLAAWARSQWTGTMIAATGSAGKTTTKDVIAHFLSTQLPTGKTVGNFNNHVGVPLSILRLPQGSEAAVLELGMNHAGEIRELAKLAKPKIGVVTNVGYAHIENFESIEGIAAAKRELIEELPSDGVAVLNADDARVAKFGDVFAGKTVTFGISQPAAVQATDVEFTDSGIRCAVEGYGVFRSPLLGRVGVLNLLAGIAVAREFGISAEKLQESAETIPVGKMRGERLVHNGITIFNDCYNSNPDAARAMIDVLRDTPATRRIAVLGEMLELGRWAESLHREVGRYAAEAGITVLVGIRGAAAALVEGARAAGLAHDAAYFFSDPSEAGRQLRSLARPGDAILFKGSRGTRVELALESFLQ